MAIVLQEVDPDDLSSVLWDYGDSSGVNNIGGVKTWVGMGGVFGLGAPGVAIETRDRRGDGAQQVVFSYDDIVQMGFRMRMQATTYDILRTGLGTLQRLLGADGVMAWIPEGSTSTYYIQRKPSSIPALFSGQELELYRAGALLEGTVDIALNRERLLRGATLEASVNKARNSTLLWQDPSVSTAPLFWSWTSVTDITTTGYGRNVNWDAQAYRFSISTTSGRSLQQSTADATATEGDVWTLSFYAKASGGSQCQCRAVIQFIADPSGVLATATGSLATLTTTEQRVSVTSSAAPAGTDHIVMSLQWLNGSATQFNVDARRVQLELASAATQYRVGDVDTVDSSIVTDMGKQLFVYNPGDAAALLRVNLTASTGADPVGYLLARRSEGLDVNLAEAANQMSAAQSSYRTKALLSLVTLYGGIQGDTATVADGTATSGGPVARTTFDNQTSLVRRWRWKSSPTDPTALHGRWDVYVSARWAVGSGTDSRYRICMHWQASNRDPVANVSDVIEIDATDATESAYVPLLLGTVEFDAGAGATDLVVEGWASQDAGTGHIRWDVLYLVPADEQSVIVGVPGFRTGQQSREVWLGSELTSHESTNTPASIAGGAEITGTKVILNAVNEGAGSPPSSTTTGGVVWAAGRHTASARVDLRVPAGTAKTGIGWLRIRKAPGPGATVPSFATGTAYAVGDFVKPKLADLNGRTYRCTNAGTSGGADPTWNTDGTTTSGGAVFTETTVASRQLLTKKNYTSTRKSFECAVDADGSTAYEIVVVAGSGITGASGKIHVLRVEHSTLRVVDEGYSVQMLGDIGVVQTADADGAAADDLVKQGPFLTAGPGLNLMTVDLWSLPPHAYDDMTDDPLAEADPDPSVTASFDVIPRYYG